MCYVLYEIKELLTITKMYITIINTLIFIISIAIVIIIIFIIIIITITVSPLVLSSYSYHVKSKNYLLKFLCQMTSGVKLLHVFLIYLFFVQKLQDSLN